MTNKEFLMTLITHDSRKESIMGLLVNAFMNAKCNPLELQLTEDYKISWEMFMPDILGCTSNDEYHIAHSISHDLTNIQYNYLKEKLNA